MTGLALAAVIVIGLAGPLQAATLSMPPYKDSLASCFVKDMPNSAYNSNARAGWASTTNRNFDDALRAAKTCARNVCKDTVCVEVFCEMEGYANGGSEFNTCVKDFAVRSW